MKYVPNKLAAAVALMSGICAAPIVSAQTQLEEVIVTATKTETSIQDTPIAVSAFSQDQLDSALINDTMNLQFNVPNMLMTKGNFTGSDIRIRGIGAGAIGSAGDSGVGVHVNGVYLNSSRIFETQFYDTERVEVLRGPQGTLYGRNTTGGVVNILTAKPNSDELSGNIEAQVGNYNSTQFKGHINVPLTDSLSFRAAGFWLDRDGFVENEYTGNDIDDREMYSGRLSLRWQGENTDINLMANFFDEDDTRARSQKQACNKDPDAVLGCLPGKLGYGSANSGAGIAAELGRTNGSILAGSNQVMAAIGAATGNAYGNTALGANVANSFFPADDFAQDFNPDDPRKVYMDFDPKYRSDETIISLDIMHDFGSFTFTSLTGIAQSTVDSQEDYEKSVPSENWDEVLQAYADLGNTPALPYELFADSVPASLAPFITDVATGVPGVGLWAGNPNVQRFDQGIPVLLPDGETVNVFNNFGVDQSENDTEQVSQEFRISTNFDGDWNFLVGAFYLDYETETHYVVRSSGLVHPGLILPINPAIYPAPFGEPGDPQSETNPYMLGYDNDTRKYELETWAIFGETYWNVTDRLTATLGLRYSDEEKNGKQRTLYVTFLDNALGEDNGFFYPQYDSQETTGRFNLTYDVSDDIMVYGTVATSYKSGGFNPISNTSSLVDPAQGGNPDLANFEPEFIDSLELGIKTTLLDGSMQLNATAFYYDYSDLQVSKIVQVTSINENTDATIMGFEGELLWAPTANLRLSANIALLDSEIEDFATIDTANPNGDDTTAGIISCFGNNYLAPNGEACDVSATLSTGVEISQDGNSIGGSPDASVNLGIAYTINVSSGLDLTLASNYYWQDEYYARNFNADRDIVESWEVWNASARLESTDGNWYADAWIKNILDEDYVTGQYLTSAVSNLFTNQFILDPQTYGVTLGYNW